VPPDFESRNHQNDCKKRQQHRIWHQAEQLTTDEAADDCRIVLRIQSEVADAVEKEARIVFAGPMPSTEAVKRVFKDLGSRLGYCVTASGCAADDGEWLYDLASNVSSHGFYLSQPLVLECETHPDPHLDGDFYKLVQARADVRVWICRLPRNQSVQEHLTIYKEQIAKSVGTQSGDTYIFFIYDYAARSAVIERFDTP
jgi:hypothetical protein